MIPPRMALEDLRFHHLPDRPILDGVHLTLAPGERIGLTGSNGSGKTTLLHLMVGLLTPQGGRVVAFGRARICEADFHEVRLKAGLLFQDPDDQLFSATVGEDVAFGPFNLGWPRPRVAEAVTRALDQVGLAGFASRITHHLSHGEKRLVCLATLLAMEPEVLLLDEPTDGLDPEHRDQVTRILQSFPAALLVVSHDREFLDQIATRRVHLEQGRLQG